MEEILVCLSGAPSNVRVIKAAAKMAEAYGENLTALYVEPPDFHEHDPGAKSRLEENFRLAHRLGAKVTRLYGEVIADAMTHIDRSSAQHKVTTVIADDYLMAYMDARLIEQVLINLVNNAVKYTPAGSTICVSAESSGGSVLVSVSDNGPGIADESKGKIFDMFYTEAKTGDSRRGLGLGLALCKSIVTAHGGEISVSDAEPHGAVFTFSLPEVKIDEQGTDTGR